MNDELTKRNEATKVWIESETLARDKVRELERHAKTTQEVIIAAIQIIQGLIASADKNLAYLETVKLHKKLNKIVLNPAIILLDPVKND